MLDIVPVIIGSVVFHHAGLLWVIETTEKYDFSVDEKFLPCCIGDP